MAKANPLTGATFYVAEGQPVPDDLPPGTRPVGPGAPAPEAEPEAEVQAPEPEVQAAPEPPPASAPKAAWVDHAVAAGVPEDQAGSMTKADLIEAVQGGSM